VTPNITLHVETQMDTDAIMIGNRWWWKVKTVMIRLWSGYDSFVCVNIWFLRNSTAKLWFIASNFTSLRRQSFLQLHEWRC